MKCVDCEYHMVVDDPDPNDWFNRDDVAIICKAVEIEKDPNDFVDRWGYKSVCGALRPYQPNTIESPKWCPLTKLNRNKILKDIL
jgi:hypothetical protein